MAEDELTEKEEELWNLGKDAGREEAEADMRDVMAACTDVVAILPPLLAALKKRL